MITEPMDDKARESSAEEKIKEAARRVFMRKGYAATRTRDIAEEAGINLALLNYYFRSKEKLFNQVMLEKIQQFFGILLPVLTDPATELEQKVELVVTHYTDILLKNPDLPIFVLSEIRGKSDQLREVLPLEKIAYGSSFMIQLKKARPDIHPFHFLLNLLSITVFPFLVMPVFETSGVMKKEDYEAMLRERKKWIPVWVKAILESVRKEGI